MDQLYLDNKPWSYIRIGLGVLSLMAGISVLLAHIENPDRLDYMLFVGFSLTGIIHITNDFGMQKTYLRKHEDRLVIKWPGKIKPKEISFTRIGNICLRKEEVILDQTNEKNVKLSLLTFRTEQKRAIYEFLIDLAKEHNLSLTRQFS